MFLAILQALAALPQILTLLKDFSMYMQKTFGDDWSKVLVDTHTAITQLSQAKTPEEKINAGKAIQNIISRL